MSGSLDGINVCSIFSCGWGEQGMSRLRFIMTAMFGNGELYTISALSLCITPIDTGVTRLPETCLLPVSTPCSYR